MKECMWVRGAHPAAITPRGVVVMAPGNLELTRQFWQILREGGDLGVIVQKLTASFASDLASLPEFVAIVASGSDLHVAIRGNYELVVHGPQGSQSVTSGSVIMWSEFRFVDVKAWRINTIASEGGFETQPERWSAIDAVVPVAIVESGDEYAAIPVEISFDAETLGTALEGANSIFSGNDAADSGLSASGGGLSAAAIDEAELGGETYLESEISADHLVIPPGGEADERAKPKAMVETGQTIGDTSYFAGFVDEGGQLVDDGQVLTSSDELEAGVESVVGDESGVGDPIAAVAEPVNLAASPEAGVESVEPELVEQESVEVHQPFSRFSQMFSENTIYRDVENAAVRDVRNDDDPFQVQIPLPAAETETPMVIASTDEPAERRVRIIPSEVGPSGAEPQLNPSLDSLETQSGDHDGHTIRSNKMDALRAKARELVGRYSADGIPDDLPKVLALLCLQGHPNPTHAQSCRECSGPMSENSVTVPQPNLGVLVLSHGVREPLHGEIIIGRQPRIHPAMMDKQRSLAVPSPKKEISRNHCEFRVTGWDVYLRDLGSNNGTFLIRPGQPPLRVSETSPVSVQMGDIVDLGDGLTMRLEK